MLTPTLITSQNRAIIKTRELPLSGKILVKLGESVKADQVVAEAELPGDLQVLRLAERTGLDLEQVAKSLQVNVGDRINSGDVILNFKGLFSLFNSEVKSPATGTVEYFTPENGHLGIRYAPQPIKLSAYVSGEVVEVKDNVAVKIKTNASIVQGIFGVGGEQLGIIKNINPASELSLTVDDFESEASGQILVGGTNPDLSSLEKVAASGAKGLVVGGISSSVLEDFLGYQLGLAITGNEDIPFTLILLEGFGPLPIGEDQQDLLRKLEGQNASINGATQVRAGAVRPEIIISNTNLSVDTSKEASHLEVGAKVKVIRYPYFAEHGVVVELPREPEAIESGAVCRVLRLKLDDGREVTIPRANAELI